MRYWIWWNDLIQGPFELDELVSLKAFDEELLVCMEDRQDWLPASRVADLSSAIEQVRVKRTAPRLPPPPPPKAPPIVRPLQGEFFADPPGQGALLESEDMPKGPYAYFPVSGDFDIPTWTIAAVRTTMPFQFVHQPQIGRTSVIELPVRKDIPPVPVSMPVITDSPVKKQDIERSIPIRIVETVPEPEVEKLRPPVEPKRPPVEPIRPPVEAIKPPAEVFRPPAETIKPSVERIKQPVETIRPSLAPRIDEEPVVSRKLHWIPWVFGSFLLLSGFSSLAYWLLDRASTRAAITESARPLPLPTPVEPKPVVIEPVPVPPKVKKIPPAAKKVVRKAPEPAVPKVDKPLPGLEPAAAKPEPPPVVVPLPEIQPPAADSWAERQNDAINIVMNKLIPGSKNSIKGQAKTMLDAMHEKELIHAAETGERLYLPDKISWAALREEGPRYRVYVNFLAMRAAGERVQTRSYQFVVDLQKKTVTPDDTSTTQDLFQPSSEGDVKHNPMAVDIESILGGVDHYNKQKMRSIIVKNNRKNKDEQQSINDGLTSAKNKVQRAILYFRKAYSDKALQNIAKAYQFEDLLKG